MRKPKKGECRVFCQLSFGKETRTVPVVVPGTWHSFCTADAMTALVAAGESPGHCYGITKENRRKKL